MSTDVHAAEKNGKLQKETQTPDLGGVTVAERTVSHYVKTLRGEGTA